MSFAMVLSALLDESAPQQFPVAEESVPPSSRTTLPAPPEDDTVGAASVASVAFADPQMVLNATLSEASSNEEKVVEDFNLEPVDYRTKGGERHKLMFQGVCTNCAHCGLSLTDADSIQTGMGPICRKRARFNQDPADASDPNQALIDLAEFPQLMDLVASKYKPQGARKMMNFLVRICSLNRRSPVHAACTDAIDSLGYKELASVLRESIKIIEITEQKSNPGNFVVWVKKSEWSWGWTNALRTIPNARAGKFSGEKGTIIPKSQKPALWAAMKKFYGGFYAKTPSGCIKISDRADSKIEAIPVPLITEDLPPHLS